MLAACAALRGSHGETLAQGRQWRLFGSSADRRRRRLGGGLEAFSVFVKHIPPEAGIAWVLIQHMAPDRESHLAEILGRETALPIEQVDEDTTVRPDRIYVIAPGQTMTIREGILRTVAEDDPLARRSSIDAFFLSLAADRGARSGCALLSGAGTDGTNGATRSGAVGRGSSAQWRSEPTERSARAMSGTDSGLHSSGTWRKRFFTSDRP